MSSKARQFNNAIEMLIDGMLRNDDCPETLHEILDTLLRVAGDWAEVALFNEGILPETRELIARHGLEP